MSTFDQQVVDRILSGAVLAKDAAGVDRDAAVLQLVDEGLTPASIMERLGVNRTVVGRVVREREQRAAARAARQRVPAPAFLPGGHCLTRRILEAQTARFGAA